MKNNMSHDEQKIYFSLEPLHIYDLDFISNEVKIKKETLLVLLSRLQKKGWITRLKRGRYLINTPKGAESSDYFTLSLNIFNGYLGFSSALYIYGAMDEMPSTVYVCTVDRTATRIVQKTEIKAVALGDRATGMTYLKNYFVSSKPKTLYDCFYMPEFAGGYSNILAAVERLGLNEDEWKTFFFYVKRFGNPSFCRKVGFLLELLSIKTTAAIPPWLLNDLNVGKQIAKIGKGNEGKFNKKWKIVNYISEEDLMGKIPWKK